MEQDKFIHAVARNTTIAGVLREMGRAYVGSNYRYVRQEVERLGLDTKHWRGYAHGTPRIIGEGHILVANGSQSTGAVKRFILRRGLIPFVCAFCGIGPEWNGKPLVLRLDHKNGIRNDHRLDNLQFLCPNCDSQTTTFCGRNKVRKPPKVRVCACGTRISAKGVMCRQCSIRAHSRPAKIEWPSKEDLEQRLALTSFRAVARELGVSDNAVRKHLYRHENNGAR